MKQKTITIKTTKENYLRLMECKGKLTWREFIFYAAGIKRR